MDGIQIGDTITRSDGQKYMIIDDSFPAANISSEIIQIPASSILANNLLGRHIGDNFNFNSQLTISNVVHSNYLEYVNNKKKNIAKENKKRRESIDIKNALYEYDFQLADELNRESNISGFQDQKANAIEAFKKAVYDSAYNRISRSNLDKMITNAINYGIITNDEISRITKRAINERDEYDKQQAMIYMRRKQQEQLEWKRAQEAEEAREQEREDRERRKRGSYRRVISSRNIKELIHFTNISNIETIVRYGILPRNIVDQEIPEALVNDMDRFDNYRNATCLSVSFPNYKMFYRYQNEDPDTKWVVISLSPGLLIDLAIRHFFFFKENAAKNDSLRCSFEEMFGNSIGRDPENPQAEILAFGIISPKYIQRIYVKTLEDKNLLEQKLGRTIDIELNTKYFKYRAGDYL